jgi:hypothetical protein
LSYRVTVEEILFLFDEQARGCSKPVFCRCVVDGKNKWPKRWINQDLTVSCRVKQSWVMAMPTIGSRRWLPSGNGVQEPADHPWLGEEGDPLHPAGALGALKDIVPEHHLEQLRPWGSAAIAAFLGIVAHVRWN